LAGPSSIYARCQLCASGDARQAADRARALNQKEEITMKNVMCILAIAMSLVGSASFAMAQSTPDKGVHSGSEENRSANTHNGEYGK
jgi:hypothetical protein